jgi:NADH:ubiquinone oxidoreductase subunit E
MKIRDLLEDKQLYRPLSAIAKNIKADWKNPGYAKPYLDAMAELDKITDKYHADDARSVVLYFLSNASTWKGPDAKEIKAELKAMLASKPIAQSNRFYNVWFKKEVQESLITEGINFGVMQQKIYEFVLKKLKELNPGMHASYAAELARTTDQFFTTAFDDCIKAFNTSDEMAEIEDELGICIEEVSNVITDYFSDAMNHPPGYAARKLKGIDRDTPTQKEIEDLIKKIDPNLEKELESRS